MGCTHRASQPMAILWLIDEKGILRRRGKVGRQVSGAPNQRSVSALSMAHQRRLWARMSCRCWTRGMPPEVSQNPAHPRDARL